MDARSTLKDSLLSGTESAHRKQIAFMQKNLNPRWPLLALAVGAFGIGMTEFTPMGLLPVIADGVGASIPEAGMLITAYALGVMIGAPIMTLAYGKVLSEPVIAQIAQNHQATPAQVALAWALQRGFAVIPSSTKRENLASNLLAPNLQLTDSEMAEMAQLERNGREVNPEGLAPLWD